jgi:MFS transporter, DHA2 family, multidrug resistance protein
MRALIRASLLRSSLLFGMFMAILDIQVVSADANPGGPIRQQRRNFLGQTTYLVVEVVASCRRGGRDPAFRLFVPRACHPNPVRGIPAGFTVASVMCGTTSSINGMIIWRALQGFIGGGMIPTVFALAYLVFPRSKQPIISSMIGLVVSKIRGKSPGGSNEQTVSVSRS